MEKKIYCKVCENCIKQCNFSQYEIENSSMEGNSVNGEIITWKCKNFVPIHVEDRHCNYNDIFFFKTKATH